MDEIVRQAYFSTIYGYYQQPLPAGIMISPIVAMMGINANIFQNSAKKTISYVDNFVDKPMIYCKSDIHITNNLLQPYLFN